MKLAINADFTKFPKAVSVVAAPEAAGAVPFAVATLPHDERHLRRRAIGLDNGDRILVDLPKPVVLNDGDRLVLEDGRQVEIAAAEEDVYDIRARDPVHLAELAWHIGNRHLAAAIGAGRILILRDHVIRDMLEGLGATVTEIVERFQPVRGAYSGHDHGHHHGDDHDEPDHGYGRTAHPHSAATHADHDHDDEPDHGSGRVARRKAPAGDAAKHEPDHGHGRIGRKRTRQGDEPERDRHGRLPGDPHYGHDHA